MTELIANRLNQTPKLVFSKSLQQAPWGKWEPCQIVRTELTNTISELKQQPGKDMVLWGSLYVAQALIKKGLIDEYRVRIVPVLLDGGRPLFPSGDQQLELDFIESKGYPSGITLVTYRPRQ